MSGIFGIVHFNDQPVDRADLKRMSSVMAHRGPDGEDVWAEASVGLGHLMLCSTEESLHEKLPWKDPSSGFCITADARIDNRGELFSALGLDTSAAGHVADSQLILSAYKKWGDSCVDHLLGDFAFAIWDSRNRRLFCARDHMGLRPFYYYFSGDLFVFASAASAVVAVSNVPQVINEGRVADFLVQELEGINKTCTFFENVQRMPPAHTGSVKQRNLSFSQYWNPDPSVELRLNSDEDYADALEDVLEAAIKCRLRSHKPAASMLSGGVDSSCIVGVSRKLSQQSNSGPFQTYSGVSDDDPDCRESRYIEMMENGGDLSAFHISPSEVKRYAADLNHISSIIEDPFDDAWTLLTLIYLVANRQGNRVVMDGIDGDGVAGLTSGYPAYLIRGREFVAALKEIRGQRKNYYRNYVSLLGSGYGQLRSAYTPNFLRRMKRKYSNAYWKKLAFEEASLSADFAHRVKLAQRYREYKSQMSLGFSPSLAHAHAERIVVPYLTVAIERYARLAAYCGVEARQPFNDKRVIELCLSMPWDQKARDGWSKFCLRNVLQRVAPHDVAWRPGFDQISWKFGKAWDAVNRDENLRVLSGGRMNLEGWLDMGRFDAVVERYVDKDADVLEQVGAVVSLSKWLERSQVG